MIKLQKKLKNNYEQYQNRYYKNTIRPILYAKKPAIQATAIVLTIDNIAHFQLPDSFLIVYAVATQGMYKRAKIIKDKAFALLKTSSALILAISDVFGSASGDLLSPAW